MYIGINKLATNKKVLFVKLVLNVCKYKNAPQYYVVSKLPVFFVLLSTL